MNEPVLGHYTPNRDTFFLLVLIEPDHKPFRTEHFQTNSLSIATHDVWFESKPNDLGSLRFCELRDGRPAIEPFDFLLHRRDIRHAEIQLHPSGRTSRAEILPQDDTHAPVTISSETVCLRMISPLNHRHLQYAFKELFEQADIGGFDLHAFKSLDRRCIMTRRVAQSFLRSSVGLMMLGLRYIVSPRSRHNS